MKTSNAVLTTAALSTAIALLIFAAIAVFAANIEPIPPWCTYCNFSQTHTHI